LKGQTRFTRHGHEIEPVATRGIVLTRLGRFLSRAIDETDELSPELGAGARVRRIEHHLGDLGSHHFLHDRTLSPDDF
jgi:hypothetical protein